MLNTIYDLNRIKPILTNLCVNLLTKSTFSYGLMEVQDLSSNAYFDNEYIFKLRCHKVIYIRKYVLCTLKLNASSRVTSFSSVFQEKIPNAVFNVMVYYITYTARLKLHNIWNSTCTHNFNNCLCTNAIFRIY
jgi:predicted ATPase